MTTGSHRLLENHQNTMECIGYTNIIKYFKYGFPKLEKPIIHGSTFFKNRWLGVICQNIARGPYGFLEKHTLDLDECRSDLRFRPLRLLRWTDFTPGKITCCSCQALKSVRLWWKPVEAGFVVASTTRGSSRDNTPPPHPPPTAGSHPWPSCGLFAGAERVAKDAILDESLWIFDTHDNHCRCFPLWKCCDYLILFGVFLNLPFWVLLEKHPRALFHQGALKEAHGESYLRTAPKPGIHGIHGILERDTSQGCWSHHAPWQGLSMQCGEVQVWCPVF